MEFSTEENPGVSYEARHEQHVCKNVKPRDFPGGPLVKNPAASAGDEGASPGWGTRISQAMGPLSPCTAVKDQLSQNLKKKTKLKPTLLTGGSDSKVSACNMGDLSSIPGSGRPLGEGNGNPLQYSCLENSTDGGACWATVHGVAESETTEQLHYYSSH